MKLLKSKNKIVEQKYYKLVEARYGADVAMLTKLRFSEIYRSVSEELGAMQKRKNGNEIITKDQLVAPFLERLLAALKKDYTFSNMMAKDVDVRAWAAEVFSGRS